MKRRLSWRILVAVGIAVGSVAATASLTTTNRAVAAAARPATIAPLEEHLTVRVELAALTVTLQPARAFAARV